MFSWAALVLAAADDANPRTKANYFTGELALPTLAAVANYRLCFEKAAIEPMLSYWEKSTTSGNAEQSL